MTSTTGPTDVLAAPAPALVPAPAPGGARQGLRLLSCGVALAALTLTATACSSSSSTTAAAAGASHPAGTTATSGASASGSMSAPGSTVITTPDVSGSKTSSFCRDAQNQAADESKEETNFASDTPAQLKTFEENAEKELTAYVAEAPSQIRSSVQTIATAGQAVFQALQKAGFDFTKLDSSTLAASLDTPAFEQAATTVSAYVEKVCGINVEDTPSS